MKHLVIDFSYFNGVSHLFAQHHYINGRRVSNSRYHSPDSSRWEWVGTRQWTNFNKNGVRRDYTEITYKEKPTRT